MGWRPQLVVKIIANTEELIKNLEAGRGAIELYGPSVAKMQDTWARHSASIVEKAALITAGMNGIGVSTLTAADAASNLKVLEAGMAQLAREGKVIPPLMQQTADSMKGASTASTGWASALGSVNTLLGAFGLAMSAAAVVRFVGSVFSAASGIHDLSLKLGISAEAVQGFKFAAEQAGSTLDAVGTAITRMNVNLSEGDKGTVAALTKAGLQFAAIRAMNPEDAFLAIADAIAKIPDPMTRSEVALQLFGKSAAELLPAIMEGFREASDGASKMSNETIESLERAEDAWGQLSTKVTIATGEMIASVSKDFSTIWQLVAMNLGFASDAATTLKGDIELLPPVLLKTAEALAAEEVALKRASNATDTLATAAKNAAQKQAAAMEELRLRGEGWQVTLSKMDEATIASIKSALALGASHGTIAAALGVTDLQMEAVAKSLKAVEASMKDAAGADEVFRTGLTFTSKVVGELSPKLDEAAAKVTKLAEANAAAEARAANQRQGGSFTVPTTTVTAANRASLEHRLAAIESGYQTLPGRRAGGNGATGNLTMDDWVRMLREQIEYASLKAALGRAGGGPVSAGSPYMVGERGPELFVPRGAGTIVPNGGGGMSLTVHVDARESFFDTPASLQRLAQKVSAAIVAEQRSYGRVAG